MIIYLIFLFPVLSLFPRKGSNQIGQDSREWNIERVEDGGKVNRLSYLFLFPFVILNFFIWAPLPAIVALSLQYTFQKNPDAWRWWYYLTFWEAVLPFGMFGGSSKKKENISGTLGCVVFILNICLFGYFTFFPKNTPTFVRPIALWLSVGDELPATGNPDESPNPPGQGEAKPKEIFSDEEYQKIAEGIDFISFFGLTPKTETDFRKIGKDASLRMGRKLTTEECAVLRNHFSPILSFRIEMAHSMVQSWEQGEVRKTVRYQELFNQTPGFVGEGEKQDAEMAIRGAASRSSQIGPVKGVSLASLKITERKMVENQNDVLKAFDIILGELR